MFIIEYQRKAILMCGDGYIRDIYSYIEELSDGNKTLYPINKFEIIKVPHHGSLENNRELGRMLDKVGCDKFIITNEDNGNVKIKDEIKKFLSDKKIYCSNECSKFNDLDVEVTNQINI